MSLRREVRDSGLGVVLARLFGGAGGVLTARMLGPAGKGRLSVALVIATLLGTAATLGLEFWTARQVARDATGVRSVILRHLWATAGFSLVAASIAYVSLPSTDRAIVVSAAGFVVAWVASMLLLAVANGRRRFDLMGLGMGGGSALYVVVLLAAWMAGWKTVGVVVAAAALANAAAAAPCLGLLRKLSGGGGIDAHRAALRLGVPAMLGEVLTYSTFRIDVALVAAFLPASRVGLYAVASAVAELLLVVPDALAQVILPRAAMDLAGRRILLLVSMVSMVIAAVLMAVLADPLLGVLFGDAYGGAATPLRLLLPGVIAVGVWKLIGADLAGRGRTIPRATSAFGSLAVLVVGDVIWLDHGGGLGAAALTSTLAYGVAAVLIAIAGRVRVVAPSVVVQ